MQKLSATSVIETPRLRLRPLKKEDAAEIFQLRSDETINKYVDRPRATSLNDAIAFIEKITALSQEGKTLYRGITTKENDRLIGTITLWNLDPIANKAEVGYELLQTEQGKGYMQEALRAVIDISFNELELLCVEGWTHPGNEASGKLLEKLGFKRDHEAEKTKPAEAKEIIYALRNPAYS